MLLPLAVVAVVSAIVAVIVVLPQTDSATGLLDLRIYLGAARQARLGESLYSFRAPVYDLSSTYPPLWTILLLPFSWLDLHVAEYVWTFVNSILWFATLAALARGAGPHSHGRRLPAHLRSWWGVVAVWLVTLPSAAVWNTLNQGQVNLVLWLLIAVDLVLVAERRRWAGFGIGLASAIKLTPAVLIVLLLGARRLRPAVVSAATAAALTGLAWLVLPRDSTRYWTDLLFDTSRIGSIGDAQNNSLDSLLYRLGDPPPRIGQVVILILSLGVLALGALRLRAALDQRAVIAGATIAGACMALISPISWSHHLVFLGFPLLLFVGRVRTWRSLLLAGACAVLLVDPVGFGRNGLVSSMRVLVLLALVVLGDRLVQFEVRWRHAGPPAPTAVPETSESTR